MDYQASEHAPDMKDFMLASARTCIESARQTLNITTNPINSQAVLVSGPWWCVVEYVTTATAVLLLELSLQSPHTPDLRHHLVDETKQVLQWLQDMSKHDLASERCYINFNNMFHRMNLAANDQPIEWNGTETYTPEGDAQHGSIMYRWNG